MEEKCLAGICAVISIALFLRLLRTCCVVSQQPDSGFFCEENSSDEDVILREEFRGVIIKQGCLLKQVSDYHYFPPSVSSLLIFFLNCQCELRMVVYVYNSGTHKA